MKECDNCRYAGNSRDTRITKDTIYCQQAGSIIIKHINGKCKFRQIIDITLCPSPTPTEHILEGHLLLPNDTGGQAAIPIITPAPEAH